MKEKWDLTTDQGVLKAIVLLGTPIPSILAFLRDFFNTDTSKQAEMVERLIRQGKKDGVDEMEIKLKKFAGISLNIPEDVNIELKAGKDEETIIKVKYK